MMRRHTVAIVAVALLLVAVPVAAQTTALVLGSIHTTDSDLSSADTLDNLIVEGSEDAAIANLIEYRSYNIVDDSANGNRDAFRAFVGDGGGTGLVHTSVRARPNYDGDVTDLSVNTFMGSGSNFGLEVDVYIVQENPDHDFGEGTLVKDNWNPEFGDTTQTIELDQAYSVAAGENYTIEFVTQNTDNDGDSDYINLRYDDSLEFSDGYTYQEGIFEDSGDWAADVTLDGEFSELDGQYVSTGHTVEGASQAFANLTLANAQADVRWEYHDGSTWQVAASDTFTSTGNHTVDISGHASATQWRANISLLNQSGSTTARLHDEGILFNSRSPTISNADPADGETVTASGGPTLSADISDGDFHLAQGDTVTAEFYLDGSLVDTQTRSSNGTISYSPSDIDGGSHSWHVELTDEYGHTVTSPTWEYQTPDQLELFNETSPEERIKSQTEVTVQFYAENGSVYERSTTNGNISFSGLPVDQDFVAAASADGYLSRTVYIESLVEQNQMYLLHENASVANVVYSLNDNTGNFSPPEETTLFIEKPLNVSGQTDFRTVTSSQFSATNEIPATLEDGQRYRLRLEGSDGSTRILGSYTTAGDDAATLTVGQVSFGSADASNPTFHANVETIDGTRVLRISYYDPADATETLTLSATNRSDDTDVIRPETTEIGPYGEYSEVIPLSSTKDHVSFNVTYEADREGYDDVNGTVFVGDLPPIAQDFGIDPEVLSAIGFLTIFAVLGLTAIAYPRFCGIPTTVVAIGLTTLGVVSIPPLLLGGSGVISLLFAVGGGRT